AYLYFPSIDQLVFIHETTGWIDNNNVRVSDKWWNDIDLGAHNNIKYYNFDYNNVHLTTDGIKALVKESIRRAEYYGLQRPYSWVQPGGYHPQIERNELMLAISGELGFKAAGIFPNPSLKVFNEYNPDNDKQYGMNFGDFRDDIWNTQQCKTLIADRIAKHHVVIGESHFTWGYEGLLGGWTGFMQRTEELIQWCIANDIPIKTYSEWSDILYRQTPNPNENIFPLLNVDLDQNNIPDGYNTLAGTLDKNDGALQTSDYSVSKNQQGEICKIVELGGIEKGLNDFEIWTKGASGNFIEVIFKVGSSNLVYKFPAESSSWTKYNIAQSVNGNTQLNIPISTSLIDVTINCSNYASGNVKVSGMKLAKTLADPDYLSVHPANIYVDEHSGNAVIYISSNISWSITENLDWLTLSQSNGSNNQEVTVYFDENNSSSSRSGEIVINGNNFTRIVKVEQEEKEYLDIFPTDIELIHYDGTFKIAVNSNRDWNVENLNDWLGLNKYTGSGNDSIEVNYEKNKTILPRDGIIKVYSKNFLRELHIRQQGAPHILELSDKNIKIESLQGANKLFIHSNADWKIKSTENWLELNKHSGFGEDSVEIDYSENRLVKNRTGLIIVSKDNISDTTLYTQSMAMPFLHISADSVFANADSNEITLNIESNTNWNIISDKNWLWAKPNNGYGNSEIKVYVKSNKDSLSRTIRMFIEGDEHVSAELFVKQKGLKVFEILAFSDSINAGSIIGNGKYLSGAEVELIANPNLGWKFSQWSENNKIVSYDSVYIFIATENRKLRAEFKKLLTDINDNITISTGFHLAQNYPNPFNPSTVIQYSIPNSAADFSTTNVTLKVYDILGDEIAVLVNKQQAPGLYEVNFNTASLNKRVP
ncbi:MAG: BACON domain-containing protein, partial [Ignavibacteriae bacterium]|nr:BACON domain-containing protein [Ignavibacteriota bacterium]